MSIWFLWCLILRPSQLIGRKRDPTDQWHPTKKDHTVNKYKNETLPHRRMGKRSRTLKRIRMVWNTASFRGYETGVWNKGMKHVHVSGYETGYETCPVSYPIKKTAIYIYVRLHTFAYVYQHRFTSTYIYMHLHTSTYVYIHVYICIYTYTYIHAYMHIHIHTRKVTHTSSSSVAVN